MFASPAADVTTNGLCDSNDKLACPYGKAATIAQEARNVVGSDATVIFGLVHQYGESRIRAGTHINLPKRRPIKCSNPISDNRV